MSPLDAIIRGALAGAVGTVAMDAFGYFWYRRDGGRDRLLDWESAAGLDSWAGAPAPAQFGRHLFEGAFQRELSPARARLVNNLVHWATGVGWGAAFGVVSGSLSARRAWHGAAFGAGVWLQSYAVLVPAKLYKPMWEYDRKTLAKELGAHLVYGLTAGTAFRVLATR